MAPPRWRTLRLRGRTTPPPSVVSSHSPSSKICRSSGSRGARISGLIHPPAPHTPCGFQVQNPRSVIDHWRALLVCRGRAPCRGSVWSSQSSRCVSDISGLSRISLSGLSGTSVSLLCGSNITSSSSVKIL